MKYQISLVQNIQDIGEFVKLSQICFPQNSHESYSAPQLYWIITNHKLYGVRDVQNHKWVAYAAVLSSGTEAECISLGVDPDFQRQGIGSKLINFIMQDIDCPLLVMVRESNTAARAFYKSKGFEVTGIQRKAYTNPEEAGLHLKLMPKPIAKAP